MLTVVIVVDAVLVLVLLVAHQRSKELASRQDATALDSYPTA
jgi:hypothetical protein